MFDLDKWQEIFENIRKHKLRTGLTAFGIFWGIFMLVLLLAAGRGLENGVYGAFGNMAMNTMFFWGERTSIPYNGFKPGRSISFNNEDYYALKKEFPEILYLNAGSSLRGNYTVSYKNNSSVFKVNGDSPDRDKMMPLRFSTGRFINQADFDQKRKVAVIGSRVAEVLFGDEDPVGKYINIKNAYFLVIGTFKKENPVGGRDDTEKIYIPISALQQTFNDYNRVNSFALLPKEGFDPEELEKKVKLFLAARHHSSPDDKSAIGSRNSGKEAKQFQGLFFGINTFVWIVGIMTIIAGIVGISNIMLIIVKERTREIGIRKALGATPLSIISMLLTESIFITSIAGYIGLSAGVGFTQLAGKILKEAGAEKSYFSNPQIDFKTAIIATIILVVSGALAGLFPAMRAANINPIEALKTE